MAKSGKGMVFTAIDNKPYLNVLLNTKTKVIQPITSWKDKNTMKNENNENNDIDNWMPKTSKKEILIAVILSPFICLTFWLWLIVICAIEGK